MDRTAVVSVSLLHPASQKAQYTGRSLKSPFVVHISTNVSMELAEGRTLEVSAGSKTLQFSCVFEYIVILHI